MTLRRPGATAAVLLAIAALAACGTAPAQQPQAARSSDVTSTSAPPGPGHGVDGPILDVPTTVTPPQLDIPGVRAQTIDGGCMLKITVENDAIGFAKDSAVITPVGSDTLQAIATHLDSAAGIEVAGFASSEGSRDYNVELSRRRAQSVADALASLLPGATFHVEGYGPDRPIADNSTEEGRRQNRRVEITATNHQCSNPGG